MKIYFDNLNVGAVRYEAERYEEAVRQNLTAFVQDLSVSALNLIVIIIIIFTRSESNKVTDSESSDHSPQFHNSVRPNIRVEMDSTLTSYFSATDKPEIELIVQRMRELEAQNGELYRQQALRAFDEPIIAKYLAELNK